MDSQAAEDVAPSERYAWVLENGLLEDYYAYLQREIISLYSRTVKKVHKINHSFIFAFCLWTNEDWYFDALPRNFWDKQGARSSARGGNVLHRLFHENPGPNGVAAGQSRPTWLFRHVT